MSWEWKDRDGTERKAKAEKKLYKKQIREFNKRVKKKHRKSKEKANHDTSGEVISQTEYF